MFSGIVPPLEFRHVCRVVLVDSVARVRCAVAAGDDEGAIARACAGGRRECPAGPASLTSRESEERSVQLDDDDDDDDGDDGDDGDDDGGDDGDDGGGDSDDGDSDDDVLALSAGVSPRVHRAALTDAETQVDLARAAVRTTVDVGVQCDPVALAVAPPPAVSRCEAGVQTQSSPPAAPDAVAADDRPRPVPAGGAHVPPPDSPRQRCGRLPTGGATAKLPLRAAQTEPSARRCRQRDTPPASEATPPDAHTRCSDCSLLRQTATRGRWRRGGRAGRRTSFGSKCVVMLDRLEDVGAGSGRGSGSRGRGRGRRGGATARKACVERGTTGDAGDGVGAIEAEQDDTSAVGTQKVGGATVDVGGVTVDVADEADGAAIDATGKGGGATSGVTERVGGATDGVTERVGGAGVTEQVGGATGEVTERVGGATGEVTQQVGGGAAVVETGPADVAGRLCDDRKRSHPPDTAPSRDEAPPTGEGSSSAKRGCPQNGRGERRTDPSDDTMVESVDDDDTDVDDCDVLSNVSESSPLVPESSLTSTAMTVEGTAVDDPSPRVVSPSVDGERTLAANGMSAGRAGIPDVASTSVNLVSSLPLPPPLPPPPSSTEVSGNADENDDAVCASVGGASGGFARCDYEPLPIQKKRRSKLREDMGYSAPRRRRRRRRHDGPADTPDRYVGRSSSGHASCWSRMTRAHSHCVDCIVSPARSRQFNLRWIPNASSDLSC